MTTQHKKTIVKSFFAASLMILACSFSASAQLGGRWSVGGDLAVPIGSWSNYATIGLGAFGKFEAPIASVPKLNWTGELGFDHFIGGTYYNDVKASTTAIPVLGGVRYYMDDRFSGFYVSGELGLTFVTQSVTDSYIDGNGIRHTASASASTTRLTFAPGAGYHFVNWDFSGRFNVQSDFTYLTLRAAYTFGK